jgi:RNA polymerase sigma factor (sigma-70 family)
VRPRLGKASRVFHRGRWNEFAGRRVLDGRGRRFPRIREVCAAACGGGAAARPIVRNVSFTLWRKRERDDPGDVEATLESEADPGPSPESKLLEACDAEQVHAALDRLPGLHREVLVLREMEECSYREISEILGVPIGTVMSRLSRARAQLVRELVGDPRSKN